MTINNSHKELLKVVVNPKYHALCKESAMVDSALLFGDKIGDRRKALTQAVRIGRSQGNFDKRYHNYQGNSVRKGNFLGKKSLHMSTESDRQVHGMIGAQSYKGIFLLY